MLLFTSSEHYALDCDTDAQGISALSSSNVASELTFLGCMLCCVRRQMALQFLGCSSNSVATPPQLCITAGPTTV